MTQNQVVLIDDEDFSNLSEYNWYVSYDNNGHCEARTNFTIDKKQKHISMHRFITNAPQGLEVDHINGNGLDNRKENLRICTKSQNLRNQHKTCGTSKYKGVSWRVRANKWESRIYVNGKKLFLGLHSDEVAAAIAYDKAAMQYFGEFAKTNILLKGGD